jgi:sigma-54 dependent transcriptional regulator, acetoin dehydrogenase operon transcriptional activator AcoR
VDIKIGLLFSFTGTTSITERGQYEAATLAIEEFNNNGQCNIEAIPRDICSDPIKSAEEAENLAKEGIKIFIGCYTSACRKAILPILEKYNCLLVYPTLYEGQECHPHVFYTGEVPNQQVHTLLNYLTHQYGKKVYCIGTDYLYPRETNRQVETYLKKINGTVVGEHYVPFGYQHFYHVLEDIISKQPDVIFSTLVGESIISFYKDYHRIGLNPGKIPIFSPITKETEIQAMGGKYGSGHYSSASYFQSITNQQNLDFVQKFHRIFGSNKVISSVMFNTYLGTKLIINSMIKTNSTDYKTIFSYLRDKKFNTICGTITIDSNYRHLSRPIKIGKVMPNGQFQIVWDSEINIDPNPNNERKKQTQHFSEMILKSWGHISKEALFVLSKNGKVQFISKRAIELTNIQEGQVLSSDIVQNLHHSFHINHYEISNFHFYFLRVKKNKNYVDTSMRFGSIQTNNEIYKEELEVAKIAAQSNANVLILGETGTGKEEMARSIHYESDRKNGPFIPINLGLLPKELIVSELFGYVEGAFTGAKKGGGIGKFEAANGGTLFLDEIGDMPLELQVMLLRAIETKKIIRLGESKERSVDVRIIAATNRDLEKEIAYKGSFRSDLFYRLSVLSIKIPSLRERIEDLDNLCQEFLNLFLKLYGKGPNKISDEVLQKFYTYHWPGNIRELRNVIEHGFLLAQKENSQINIEHLPRNFKGYIKMITPIH